MTCCRGFCQEVGEIVARVCVAALAFLRVTTHLNYDSEIITDKTTFNDSLACHPHSDKKTHSNGLHEPLIMKSYRVID